MKKLNIVYFGILCFSVAWWLVSYESQLFANRRGTALWLYVATLYLFSHFLRIARLVLLTLDEREYSMALVRAHVLTAFPGVLMPFKLGEVIRLAAFLRIYNNPRKALSVWFCERLGDLVIISAFILGFYLLNSDIPAALQVLFFIFVSVSILGLVSIFATAKVLVYVNRHLVLSSLTKRSLIILQTSYQLRRLEFEMKKTLEGRVIAFLLTSVLIWMFELLALICFSNEFIGNAQNTAELFAAGLLTNFSSVYGGGDFGFIRSLTLLVFMLLFFTAGLYRFIKSGVGR